MARERGSVLLWVLFLLLIVTSSVLAVGKSTFSQLKIVGFYDQRLSVKREYRGVRSRLVKALASSSGVIQGLQYCLDLAGNSDQLLVCGESNQADWSIRGELLDRSLDAELNALVKPSLELHSQTLMAQKRFYRFDIVYQKHNRSSQWLEVYSVEQIETATEDACLLCVANPLSTVRVHRLLSWRVH